MLVVLFCFTDANQISIIFLVHPGEKILNFPGLELDSGRVIKSEALQAETEVGTA